MPDNECILCGAPGGYPYCNDACREADNPEEEDAPAVSAVDFGPLTDIAAPWEETPAEAAQHDRRHFG